MSGPQVNTVFTARDAMQRTLNSIEGSARRLDRTFGSLRGRIRSAFEFHVVGRGVSMLENGLYRVARIIPDLIGRGEQWARTVDAITDATGMSAEQASLLAGAQQRVGGSAASLTTAFVGMAKSVIQNREAWQDLGVEVVRGNDGAVDAFATFQNLRQAVAATGGSLLSTAAAQKLLGRGGKELLDLLQLSDRQWRLLTDDVRRSGQVMSETAAANAEALERSRNRMQATLDGLGSKLLDNLAPVLTRFVDGFATFIQNNMDQIVRLVVGGANTILTVVGSLLGMDLGSWSFSEQLGGLGNDARRAADGLRETAEGHRQAASAADRHSDAIARSRREQQRLRNEVGRAYRELFSIQQQASPVNASDLETELWRQRKIREVKDAQDRVAEAERALRQHRRTMDRMVDITSTASRRMQADLGDALVPKKKPGSGGTSGIFGNMDEILRESTLTGLRIAEALRTAIFGPEAKRSIVTGGLSFEVSMGRSGGLITHLQNVGKFLDDVGGHLSNLNGLLGGNGPLVLGLAALTKLLPGGLLIGAGKGGAALVQGLFGSARPGGGAASPGGGGGPGLGGALSGLLGAAFINLLTGSGIGNKQLDEYGPFGGMGMSGWDEQQTRALMERLERERRQQRGGHFNPAYQQGMTNWAWRWAGGPMSESPWGPPAAPPPPPSALPGPAPGFGIRNPFEVALRRYLGASSPIDQGQQDQLGILGGIFGAANTTAEQTAPLGAGQFGVMIQNQAVPIFGNVAATLQGQSVSIAGNVGALIQNTDLTVKGRVDSVVQNTTLRINGEVVATMVAAQEELLRNIVVNTGRLRTDFVDRLSINGNGLLVRMAGGGGTAGLAGKVANLEDSVKALAGVNGQQNKRMGGIEKTADKALSQNKYQGRTLDTHEARLDALDGGGTGPHHIRAAGGGGEGIAARRTASESATTNDILRDIRRLLRDGARGGPSTSSLRAGTG